MSVYDVYCEFYHKFHKDFPDIFMSIEPNSIIIESRCFPSSVFKKFFEFLNSKVEKLDYTFFYINTGVRLTFEFRFYK